ncbi:unnamed protein product [Paramecium octaurelia]|uniref:Uncharacterized protein n=1 Tax=Paramecium octaurelia TaxID=43137 RepID=A0A8S1U6Z9_PAROT|nr:unnamed protein product [Paramecium octaurelia]
MVKSLWCLKELSIFGMLFHKAVCLEYLYSKSLDKLKQAKLTQLITKTQYLNEKRNLRKYFMLMCVKLLLKCKKSINILQQILMNYLLVQNLKLSDFQKVCYESQESCQNSELLQTFQNQIEIEYNSIANYFSGNLQSFSLYYFQLISL